MQRFGTGITMAIGTEEIKIGRQVCRQAAKSKVQMWAIF